MGIKGMQGVPAHIEYIRKDPEIIKFVNCKFWKDEICYNNISTKYGERCCSKRGCMYSIPLPKGSKKVQASKNSNSTINKSKLKSNNLNIYNMVHIIDKYFSMNLEKEIRIENKSYKIKTSYNKEKDILILNILYNNKNYNFNFRHELKLKEVIKIQGNQLIFNVKLGYIVDRTSKANKKLGKLIKENNIHDITRKASIDNNEEIIKSRDSLIKYTSYIITRELMKLYK